VASESFILFNYIYNFFLERCENSQAQLNQASTFDPFVYHEKIKNQLYLVVNFDQEKNSKCIKSVWFCGLDKRRPDTCYGWNRR